MIKKISIIGTGRLGLCFALNLERMGFDIIAQDIIKPYIKQLNARTFISNEPCVNELLKKSQKFKATTSLKDALNHANILFVFVATPSLKNGRFDHSQINRVLNEILHYKKPKCIKHLIIGCTVMPGYCNSIVSKMKKHNYTVSYNPQFIAQGSIIKNQLSSDILLMGGYDGRALSKIKYIYLQLGYFGMYKNIYSMTLKAAEITKLALNCFLTTKIAFANLIGDIAVKSGEDTRKILTAIGSDKRIGKRFLNYGYGYGGLCFPRDNVALMKYCDDLKIKSMIPSAVHESNKLHLKYQIDQFVQNHPDKKSPTALPAAFKPGTDIIDHSQQLEFAVKLASLGYNIIVKDNPTVIKKVKEQYGSLFTYKIIN